MFVLYHPRVTAIKRIARELNVSVYYPNHAQRNRIRSQQAPVLVNWGCSHVPPHTLPMLNADISASVRKMRTFELLQAAQLPIPRTVTNAAEIIDGAAFYMRGRYLGRKDGLTGGAGITVYAQGTLPPSNAHHDFYSQVVSKQYEVRLHVARGEVICEQFKFVPQGSQVLIRNYDNGARFTTARLERHIDHALAERARDIAIRAVSACNMDFGALDMALTTRGNWVIFEINSAPGLSQRDVGAGVDLNMPSTYDAYLSFFRTELRGDQ